MQEKETKQVIVSPLRYPGGKTKAIKRILPLIPEYDEFREPMVGGGSVFFALKNKNPTKTYWINDINRDLYLFWKYCKEEPENLISQIETFHNMFYKGQRRKYSEGKQLYYYLMTNKAALSNIKRAARFFILNRITFSGLVDSGGYSKIAYKKRFTKSSIERVRLASQALQDVRITNMDYKELVKKEGKNTFIFLDPPYMSNAEAKLYGVKGRLHANFRHKRLADNMKSCKHKYLITYDNCSGVQQLYKFANSIEIQGWKLQYGTNNSNDNKKKKEATIGEELFIFGNYVIKAEQTNKVKT